MSGPGRAAAVSLLVSLAACADMEFRAPEPGELFPGGKPLGQPRSSACPEVRMVRVSSVREADDFHRALRERYPGCAAVYVRREPAGAGEVGIIRIADSAMAAGGVREIRFVQAVRPMGKSAAAASQIKNE